MVLKRSGCWLCACALSLSCGATAPSETEVDRILVFSKTVGFRHASIEPGIAMLTELAAAENIAVDATEDALAFEPDELRRYRAVVFLSTTGDVLSDVQQLAFEDYMRGGGAYLGIHSASDTEYDWPWYGRLVGAYFDGHPSNPGIREGRLLVVDPDHAASRALPSPWDRSDEWYDLRDVQVGLSVLLDIDETSYKTAGEGPAPAPRAIAWYQEFDGGRSFYTALGHTVESYQEPLFRAHIRGALEWVTER